MDYIFPVIGVKRMKQYRDVFKQLVLISQLGISIITPTLVCILICVYISNKTGVGGWIYIIGFVFGLGASFMTAYKFYKAEVDKKEPDRKEKVSFNKHI